VGGEHVVHGRRAIPDRQGRGRRRRGGVGRRGCFRLLFLGEGRARFFLGLVLLSW
jgi:hypothetical protein